MKKIIGFAVVLAVIATSATFAAPRRDAGDLRFGYWTNVTRTAQTNQVLELFTQQTGIYVETIEGTFGEFWPMMDTLSTTGNLPDMMQHDVAHLLRYHQNNLLLDLRPFINDNRIDVRNLPAATVEQGRLGAGIYAIPIGMNFASVLYNRTLLDSLGLTAPRNMNVQQFIDLSREIYRRSGVRTNWVSNDPTNPLIAILRGQNVELFERTPAGGFRMGGTPANYQVFFDILHQGIQEGWHFRAEHWGGRDRFALTTDPMVYPANLQANANLRSWMAVAWNGQAAGFQGALLDGTVALTTPPSANPARSNFGRASMFWSISAQASNPAAAAQLISFFINNQQANEIIQFERGVPANSVILTAITPLLSPPNQAAAEFATWVSQPGNSTPFDGLAPPARVEIRDYLTLVSDLVAMGQLTPAAAATRFFNEANAMLAR